MWELDDRLIDTDMLQLEGDEANKVYLDLKSRALRRQQNEKKRKKMDDILDEDEGGIDDASTSEKSTRSSVVGDDQKRIQQDKLLGMLKKMGNQEKLDFTTNVINHIENSFDRRNYDTLMPGLTQLSTENSEIKKALLNQIKPLTQLFSEKFGLEGYTVITDTVFPILGTLLYDNDEQVRDKAVFVVGEMRKVV